MCFIDKNGCNTELERKNVLEGVKMDLECVIMDHAELDWFYRLV